MKIVVKIEITSLFDLQGGLDDAKIERLAMILSNLQNSGRKIIVVSSGAILLGSKKFGLTSPPDSLTQKQAFAAIGQAELIDMYQRYFGEYNQIVAQVLLTPDVVDNIERSKNATNTLNKLLDRNIIPIINENDAVSTDDIILEDNYPLVLNVAQLVDAHVILVKCEQSEDYFFIEKGKAGAAKLKEKELFESIEALEKSEQIHLDFSAFPQRFKEIKVC